MNKLQEISKEPGYQEKASSFSKLIIFVFFLSYVYNVIFNGGNPGGWIKPTIFFFLGLIISSIFIAMPFFLLKRLFPKISILISVISIVVTFLITKLFFVLFLNL